jgi:hypothetical protein
VELGQVRGDRVIRLWRAPESAPPVPLDRLGRWLSVIDRRLRFTAIASIVPSQDAEEMRGAIAVSTEVPADMAVGRLAAHAPGRLIVGDAPVEIGGGIPEGTATIEVPLDELPGKPRLVLSAAAITPPLVHALRGIGAAALLAGLAIAAVMVVRGRRRRPAPRRSSQEHRRDSSRGRG